MFDNTTLTQTPTTAQHTPPMIAPSDTAKARAWRIYCTALKKWRKAGKPNPNGRARTSEAVLDSAESAAWLAGDGQLVQTYAVLRPIMTRTEDAFNRLGNSYAHDHKKSFDHAWSSASGLHRYFMPYYQLSTLDETI